LLPLVYDEPRVLAAQKLADAEAAEGLAPVAGSVGGKLLFLLITRRGLAMKRYFCGLMALGLLLCFTGHGKAQPTYGFTSLDGPGLTYTDAYGINASGQVVDRLRPGSKPHGCLPETRVPGFHRQAGRHEEELWRGATRSGQDGITKRQTERSKRRPG